MTPTPTARDALSPFVVEGAAVRGAWVTLGATTRSILASHAYPPALARALCELCAATALLASTLKQNGSLVVQLAGTGPVRLAVVECSDTFDLRATAQWNAEATSSLGDRATLVDLAGARDRARLTITLDPKGGGPLYQGIVALDSTSIAASIEHYLAASEQLPSRMCLVAHDRTAAGLLIQRLPGGAAADEATWRRLVAEVDALSPADLLAHRDAAAALSALFPEEELRLFDAYPVRFHCSCSEARVENALRIAGRAEIDAALTERGHVEVTCEFCTRHYRFGPDDVERVFAHGATLTAALPD